MRCFKVIAPFRLGILIERMLELWITYLQQKHYNVLKLGKPVASQAHSTKDGGSRTLDAPFRLPSSYQEFWMLLPVLSC